MPFPYDLFRGLSQPQTNFPIDRRDLLNYTGDNTIQSSRYINPITHDFEVSSTNHFVGQNAVEQSVTLALNTTFNSSAQLGFGQSLPVNIRLVPTDPGQLSAAIFASVQQTLATPIQNKQITIQDISYVNNGNGQISVRVAFHNNTLGTTASVSFILQG